MSLRILLVSQALGTPADDGAVPPFSAALPDLLKRAGATVTLVVERSSWFDRAGRPGRDEAGRVAAVYRYLEISSFRPRLAYSGRIARWLARDRPGWLRGQARLRFRLGLDRETPIANRPANVTGRPPHLDYLAHVDAFLFAKRFYSSAIQRAVTDTGTVEIDGSGYDWVLLDGPHNVAVRHLASSRVLTLLRDLAPVTDPDILGTSRRVFAAGIARQLGQGSPVAFASPAVASRFAALFGARDVAASPILRPALPDTAGRVTPAAPPTSYLAALARQAQRGDLLRRMSRTRMMRNLLVDLSTGENRLSPDASWNVDLPVFVSDLSGCRPADLKLVAAAVRELSGWANVIAMGAVPNDDGTARPGEDLPNLHWADDIGRDDRVAVIASATGLILPRPADGSGFALVEHGVAGMPLIVPDSPANRDFDRGQAAYFARDSSRDLVRAVRAVLAEPDAFRVRAQAFRDECMRRYSVSAALSELTTLLPARRGDEGRSPKEAA